MEVSLLIKNSFQTYLIPKNLFIRSFFYSGVPPLTNETRVIIRVGIPGNQRPVFKGNYNKIQNMLAGPASYKASVAENAPPGTVITTVVANDPDGIDSLINYYIAGGDKDNFLIDKK